MNSMKGQPTWSLQERLKTAQNIARKTTDNQVKMLVLDIIQNIEAELNRRSVQ